jgi:hypothetical protein
VDNVKKTLSVPAIAQELSLSPDKIRAWIKSGELVAMNLATDRNGRRARYAISRDSLDEFLRGRQVVPSGAKSTTRRLHRRPTNGVKQFF